MKDAAVAALHQANVLLQMLKNGMKLLDNKKPTPTTIYQTIQNLHSAMRNVQYGNVEAVDPVSTRGNSFNDDAAREIDAEKVQLQQQRLALKKVEEQINNEKEQIKNEIEHINNEKEQIKNEKEQVDNERFAINSTSKRLTTIAEKLTQDKQDLEEKEKQIAKDLQLINVLNEILHNGVKALTVAKKELLGASSFIKNCPPQVISSIIESDIVNPIASKISKLYENEGDAADAFLELREIYETMTIPRPEVD